MPCIGEKRFAMDQRAKIPGFLPAIRSNAGKIPPLFFARRAPWKMAIKSDKWIRRMAEQHGMIEPFSPQLVREVNGQKIVSYGTSSYGYDIRCAREFRVFTNINHTVVDPKNFDPQSFVEIEADYCIIPPNSFALARTVEYFRIPRDTLVICLGKSTYARCGLIVNVTPSGKATSPSSSPTPRPCPPRSTPARAAPRCSSSRPTRSARRPTRTGAASTRGRWASPCPRSDAIA